MNRPPCNLSAKDYMEGNEMADIEMREKRDGLRMILMFYRNQGQLSLVEKNTGIPKDILRKFCDGENCLTPEQDKLLREPLKEYGSKDVEVSIKLDIKP